MAAAALSRVKTFYVGPVRVMRMQAFCAGADTITGIGVYAGSTSNHRAFAITRTPLVAGAEDTAVNVTSVTAGKPTLTIQNGGANDNLLIGIWNW